MSPLSSNEAYEVCLEAIRETLHLLSLHRVVHTWREHHAAAGDRVPFGPPGDRSLVGGVPRELAPARLRPLVHRNHSTANLYYEELRYQRYANDLALPTSVVAGATLKHDMTAFLHAIDKMAVRMYGNTASAWGASPAQLVTQDRRFEDERDARRCLDNIGYAIALCGVGHTHPQVRGDSFFLQVNGGLRAFQVPRGMATLPKYPADLPPATTEARRPSAPVEEPAKRPTVEYTLPRPTAGGGSLRAVGEPLSYNYYNREVVRALLVYALEHEAYGLAAACCTAEVKDMATIFVPNVFADECNELRAGVRATLVDEIALNLRAENTHTYSTFCMQLAGRLGIKAGVA